MKKDNQTISKEEKQWLEEAESDVLVEELAIARTEESDSKIVSFGKKIMGEADAINLAVISFLAFLIALFLTIISFSEESSILLAVTLIFYLIGIIYAINWYKRLKTEE
ncbi:MAG: hypothetical protein KAR35_11835 [Candidatus Heimdallarchaeota archaeon]|nr:hypothetical protein [Candidatus Heimdallarchaeota archaeon]MCK5050053.1 hypothetical protein [Candidatus Heimdallarchaeota archaeon]